MLLRFEVMTAANLFGLPQSIIITIRGYSTEVAVTVTTTIRITPTACGVSSFFNKKRLQLKDFYDGAG